MQDKINIIGIDPGKNGGIAFMKESGKIIIKKIPEVPSDLYELLSLYQKASKGNLFCYLEKVHGMPKMSGGGMFNFGKGYGWIEMALIALKIPTESTTPQKWQKHFELGEKKGNQTDTEWKNKLRAKAVQLFPKQEIFLWGADALLIAEYGRRTIKI